MFNVTSTRPASCEIRLAIFFSAAESVVTACELAWQRIQAVLLGVRLVAQRDRAGAELEAAYEPQVDMLRQAREQRWAVAR